MGRSPTRERASLVYIMVLYAVGVLSFSLLSYEVLYIKVRSIIRKLENHFTTYSHFFLSSSFNIPISKLTSTMYYITYWISIGYWILDISSSSGIGKTQRRLF